MCFSFVFYRKDFAEDIYFVPKISHYRTRRWLIQSMVTEMHREHWVLMVQVGMTMSDQSPSGPYLTYIKWKKITS